ncbi:MAG: nucleotide exchange factor GrpE [Pseudazoarcus pumilus]|nr:nucleotide exchange factor GrpE [Pseudazoarcus pumilus]
MQDQNHNDPEIQHEQAASAETDTAATADSTPSLEETIRIAEQKAAEHHDAWLRAKAEAENIRRRAQEDIAKASKFAAEKFASAMLPVKDSLEAALATENQTLEKLREGVELTLKQLNSAFEGAAVSEENPLGTKFDPNKHQAIGAIESDAEPNTVVTVLQKGYTLHERVLRPALVQVAKGK